MKKGSLSGIVTILKPIVSFIALCFSIVWYLFEKEYPFESSVVYISNHFPKVKSGCLLWTIKWIWVTAIHLSSLITVPIAIMAYLCDKNSPFDSIKDVINSYFINACGYKRNILPVKRVQ
jgi:hypothetical protein